MKKRNHAFDLLCGICIIRMVSLHIMQQCGKPNEDWWLEMTNAMPQRGCKLMGETYAQMRVRMAEERKRHPDVKQFVREYDERGAVVGWHWENEK